MHPLAINPPEPLSQREEKLLAELEAVIDANMKGFVLVGLALTQIRDQRLYRVQYPTFEEYVLRVWDMARRTAYQLMEATEVYGNLRNFLANVDTEKISLPENVRNCAQNGSIQTWEQIDDLLPKNEAQARPLTLFTPEEQRVVWLDVLDKASATGTKITANFIIQVILERQRKEINDRVKKHADRTHKEKDLPPLVKTTYQALLQVVANQNDEDWKEVGKHRMIDLLEDLLASLKS